MDAAAVQIDQWSDDASFIFCRLIHMEGDGFLSDILLNGICRGRMLDYPPNNLETSCHGRLLYHDK